MELTDEQFKTIREALDAFEIEKCDRCDGSGHEPHNDLDACRECGGCGEELVGGWPPDVREAQKVIRELSQQ